MNNLFGAFSGIEQEKDGNGDDRICTGTDKLMPPKEVVARQTEKTVIDEKEQDTIKDGKNEGDDDAGEGALHIDLQPNACSDIADSGLGHTVDADGLVGERVLQQADDRPGKGSGDGVAAADGEEENDDERQIEQGEARKKLGEEGLQKNCQQRHEKSGQRREGVLLEFSAGCVAAIEHCLQVLRCGLRGRWGSLA